jgi:Arylsulfatase A and related enzymes
MMQLRISSSTRQQSFLLLFCVSLLLSPQSHLLCVKGAAASATASEATKSEKNESAPKLSPEKRNKVTAKKKPNILVILADDVGTGDIPIYWNSSLVHMPNINWLAAKGVTFEDAHASSLCAPSRYMLLSGNYPHRGTNPGGSWAFWEDSNQFANEQKSIAEVLRDEAGYDTSMFGKWHLGARVPPTGIRSMRGKFDLTRILTDTRFNWSLPIVDGPQDIGFDKSYITIGGIQAPPYSFYRDGYLSTTHVDDILYWDTGIYDMPHGKSKIGNYPGEGDKDWDSTAYNMILVNETISFIDNHLETSPDKPFFTYVALGAVHIPHSPPDFYLDGTRVREEMGTEHLDMLLEMDKVVGSLVNAIESRDLAEETVIIFSSDNGGLRNSQDLGHETSGPLRGKKGDIWEGGHRVPLIMRYDGTFPQNQRRAKTVGLNDIYSTLCDIVGITPPRGSAQDSMSFAKYILSEQDTSSLRDSLGMWTYGKYNGRKQRLFEAFRMGNLKLVHKARTAQFELYDLKNDISESIDLSKDPSYKDVMEEMYRQMIAIGPCPKDRRGKFTIPGMKKEKGCMWFRKDPSRCQTKPLEGELYCASICGRNLDWCT